MSLFFILNNLHFAFEILGALVFFMVAWLAWDSYALKRDAISAIRGSGFLLLAGWQMFHAFGFTGDIGQYAGHIVYILGLAAVAFGLGLERPVRIAAAVLVLPAFARYLDWFNGLALAGFLLITLLSYRQYRIEQKKSLIPFWAGFLALSLGALAALFYETEVLNPFWIIGHLFQIAGFIGLAWWVWQYLEMRIRESMVLIFVSMALAISTVVTLAFSTILVSRVEAGTRANLLTNVRVEDFAIARLTREASAKARLLSLDNGVAKALRENDFLELERIITGFLKQEGLGFVSVVDENGEVLMRAHALPLKSDNIAGERAVREALSRRSFATIESSAVEKFSIRASSPLLSGSKLIGAVVAGFPLDDAFVDNVKRITGLEMSIYEGRTRIASTIFNPDGRSRSTGARIADEEALDTVLKRGDSLVTRTDILGRPFLASFLPIKNADGAIVGMLSAAEPQQAVIDIANAANRLTFLAVAVIILMLIAPIYIITRRMARSSL